MSHFRPTRASPPLKPTRRLERTGDISQSSAGASVPELTDLSQADIDLLDAVINRAGPDATTFLTVFKAYTDVLDERGLDPQEVVYYGKLLKLGTMKGKNWVEKWKAVKSHQHISTEKSSTTTRHHIANSTVSRNSHVGTSATTEDAFSSPFHANDYHRTPPSSNSTLHNLIHGRAVKSYHQPSLLASDTSDDLTTNSLLLTIPQTIFGSSAGSKNEGSTSTSTTFTTPQPHRVSTRPLQVVNQSSTNHNFLDHPVINPSARKVISNIREARRGVINADDAWEKIRMEKDEGEADAFRRTRLLERCWVVWSQLYRWILTTHEQISEARNHLTLRVYLERWRKATSHRRDAYRRGANVHDIRCLKKALTIWTKHLKTRKHDHWRRDMRQRMKIVQVNRDQKLRTAAFTRWRQYQLSGQQYRRHLMQQFYDRWKRRLIALEELDLVAANKFDAFQQRITVRSWERWRTATEMKMSEQIMNERINVRLMRNAMSVWQKTSSDHQSAREFHQLLLVKSSIRSWKAARDRIYNLEGRALKHVTRQDGLLIRAVFRVWKARRRGNMLERLKTSNLIYAAWEVWKQRMQQSRHNNELAVAFNTSVHSKNLVSHLHKWHQTYEAHRNAQMIAIQCDTEQICYKVLLTWRLRLRDKLKMARMASMATVFFATRRAWRVWHEAIKRRTTEKHLAEFQRRRMKQVFYAWLHRTREVKQRIVCEQIIRDNIKKRILRGALTAWTNHVIKIKLRELDIAQSYSTTLRTVTFKKWRAILARRLETVSLMQSYILVKREETLRRIFAHWRGMARMNRHRRIILQENEDAIKFSVIARFWDKWRGRFSDERLRPIERIVMIQTEKNALFRAFGLWHSKTRTLPAIRFYATNTKAKYFNIWLQAMPKAIQATKAREVDRYATIKKCMEKWVQVHRTKVALKAVARARYLRLPTAAPRQTRVPRAPEPRELYPRVSPSNPPRASSSVQPDSPEPNITSLLRPRPFSMQNPGLGSGSKTHENSRAESSVSANKRVSSPTRTAPLSEAGTSDDYKSRLWQELREVRRKSRPSSLHSLPRI